MKEIHFTILFFLLFLLPFSVLAQLNVEEKFEPLPIGVKQITGVQYIVNEKDTTAENFSEYNFDKKGNMISYQDFSYHIKEERKYDSLDRIVEIDALYGESFNNGISRYQYPSKNQKIEIHDKLAFYKEIKSKLIYDSNNRVITEIKQDSTVDLMDSTTLLSKISVNYLYDKNGNLIEEYYSTESNNEIIYTHKMNQVYENGMLVRQAIHYYKKNSTDDYYTDELKEIFYLKQGRFKGKISKETDFITSKNDTVKSEIDYFYQELDSTTIIQERKQAHHKEPLYHQKYFYKNNHLIKVEEYTIPKEGEEPKLKMWTEYTYYFYPKPKQ